MTGEELLQELQRMTTEQRALPVMHRCDSNLLEVSRVQADVLADDACICLESLPCSLDYWKGAAVIN